MWNLLAEARRQCLQDEMGSGLFLLLCSPLSKIQSRERLCDGPRHTGVWGLHWMGADRAARWTASPRLIPVEESGESPSKVNWVFFSRRMGKECWGGMGCSGAKSST